MSDPSNSAFVVFRLPSPAAKRKAQHSRHHERTQVRMSVTPSLRTAISLRDRLNANSVTVDERTGEVVTRGGIRIKIARR